MQIVSVKEMVQYEKNANLNGTSYETMMRNAGNGIAAWLRNNLDLKHGVVGLAGSGNNGGDTLIALTHLSNHNVRTFAFLLKQRPDDPLVLEYLNAGGVVVDISAGENLSALEALLSQNAIILDGILGTGFRLPLRGPISLLMADIHKSVNKAPAARIIAVDCPSGVDCDSGEVSSETLAAETTLTMAAAKQGLLKYPARAYTGNIERIEIGIPIKNPTTEPCLPKLIDREMVNALIPQRPETSHKGTFGTCLVLAGTEKYSGAAYLAGKAAYRAGCGLVNIATVGAVRDALAGQLIEAVWTVLPGQDEGYHPDGVAKLRTHLEKASALVIGPGWGLNESNAAFLTNLLAMLPDDMPTLIDADGLKLLADIPDWWHKLPGMTVLTPHPGEMSVLTELSIVEIEENRWEIARSYAKKWGATLVLKGAVSAIGTPEGGLTINPVGDSALATAGSGDVLSGIIGGLMAQGMTSQKSAALGVWLHAKAGQRAHLCVETAAGVTAIDILDQVGREYLR